MITVLRHFFVDTWLGRAAALIVFLSFIGLGGTFVGLGGGGFGDTGNHVVKLGKLSVTPQELAHSINQQVVFLQQTGIAPEAMQSPAAQNEISHTALRNIIVAKEAELAARRNGIFLSDDTIVKTVHEMPEFKDEKGQFDSVKMDNILNRNGLDHAFLVSQTKRLLYSQATMLGFGGMVTVPTSVVDHITSYFTKIRSADIAEFPFAAGPGATSVNDKSLKRFYSNHLDLFKEPELRHARIVALTPESVSKTLEVPDSVLQNLYKERSRDYNAPETRTVQVLAFHNEADAKQASQKWGSSQNWDAVQKLFPKAIPASLDDARQSDFPDEDLAKAVFALKVNVTSSPVKTAAGWSVVRVLKITPPRHVSFEQVRDKMRDEVRQGEANVALRARLKSFEEAIAGSTTLDKIPDNIGAIPAEGSLDEHGLTQSGSPAPLPGNEELQKAIIKQIFSQKKGEYPRVISLKDGSAFAILVEDIIPGRQKSFEEAHTQVLLAWQADQKKREANIKATDFYQKAKKAQNLEEVIDNKDKAIHFRRDMKFSVTQTHKELPALVSHAVVRMKKGEIVMLESADSFWLIHFKGEQLPPQNEYVAVQQRLKQQLAQGLQDDIAETIGMDYTRQIPPKKFNPTLFNQVSQSALQQVLATIGRAQ
ncbi:peptidylprolyl isomerase [Aristophania vespae]|uniref:peptidylprolyl isomerase n=1 Tax=Aristophania vespae TaxID=2697033 RepID=UPI002351AC31|nr:peptidyl-prolyl cis-trans isomerase [Aristophania vespae]UMM64766.1 hypothetical protein DM15PD_17860 [Aristophania vespae]